MLDSTHLVQNSVRHILQAGRILHTRAGVGVPAPAVGVVAVTVDFIPIEAVCIFVSLDSKDFFAPFP